MSKLWSSWGINEVTDEWLRILGRLSNATLLFPKDIFKVLLDCSCTGFVGSYFISLIL